MNIEDAIWALRYVNPEDPTFTDAIKTAIAALHAQAEAERNNPLTLDELRQMDGEPVYIASDKRGAGYCIVDWHGAKENKWVYFSRTGTAEGMSAKAVFAKDYGVTWLAYRRKPKGELK